MRDELDKDFQQYIDSQVKLEPNWDRNVAAPRPKKPQGPPQQKRKPVPKKRPKPQTKNAENPAFEDVKFVTPPLTPEYLPPKQPEIIPATNQPDDDFWNFFDQGLPPIR